MTMTYRRLGDCVLPYFPLQYGLLTGKYSRGGEVPAGSRADKEPERTSWLRDADWDRVDALTAYAEKRDLWEPT